MTIDLDELEGLLHDSLNRIDGVYVGDPEIFLKKVLGWIEDGWYLFVAGDDFFEKNDNFNSLGYLRYSRVNENNYKELYETMTSENRRIDVLYIFDENLHPVLSIDDYPEDVSVYIDFLNLKTPRLVKILDHP